MSFKYSRYVSWKPVHEVERGTGGFTPGPPGCIMRPAATF